MTAARVALLVFFFAIVTLMVLETARRRRLSALVPAGQYRLRMFIASLFLLEIGLMLAASFWFAVMQPLSQVLFLSICILIALIIVVAALFDLRLVMVNYLIERRNLFRSGAAGRKDGR
jgi:hypothetical protein